MADAWIIYEALEGDIECCCRKHARRCPSMYAELRGECAIRFHNVLSNWKPWLGGVRQAVKSNMHWYCFKYVSKKREVLEQLPGAERRGTYEDDVLVRDAVDEVKVLLEALSPAHSRILTQYLMLDMTFQDIADDMRCSKGTARTRYLEALAEARVHGFLLSISWEDPEGGS